MPLFVLTCLDRPNSLALRMATRDAHLAYAGARRDALKLGGPLLDEAGDMTGSLMILEAADLAAAEAFSAADPYRRAGLFERVEIKPFRVTLGQL
ncbi:YciI family protein [Phenylobacterium sp.]|uniref:YciI family protein n=1 Tax=Phenylobacterium sp. TaxID=1871053 RepID=UPI00286ABC12|nr:YciI family protein [Phenylobacterium sp.]